MIKLALKAKHFRTGNYVLNDSIEAAYKEMTGNESINFMTLLSDTVTEVDYDHVPYTPDMYRVDSISACRNDWDNTTVRVIELKQVEVVEAT